VSSREADAKARQAEALAEIESQAGSNPTCPYCSANGVIRWGRSDGGLQRWRCRGCRRTFNSAHGTALAHTRRRDDLLAFIRDMLGDGPRSCRKAAARYGVHRMTAWRWRMLVLRAVEGIGSQELGGIVEADETFARESRKGSREWVNHERDPANVPAPPRWRWYEYSHHERPMQRGLSRWQVPVLTVLDRSGGERAEVLSGLSYKHLGPVLHRHLQSDTILCSDKAHAYKKFARQANVRHVTVRARQGERVRDGTFHIQNVNAFHSRFKEFLRPFCGPATRNLRRYVAWFLFRQQHGNDPQAANLLFREVIRYA